MALSKAARELKRRLRPQPPTMNQSQLAETLGVSQQAVSAWTKGRAMPEVERMAKIETLLGIPMRDWAEAAEAPADSGPDLDDEDDEDDDATAPARVSRSAPAA